MQVTWVSIPSAASSSVKQDRECLPHRHRDNSELIQKLLLGAGLWRYTARRHDYKMLRPEAVSLVCAEGLTGTWCLHRDCPHSTEPRLLIRGLVMNLVPSSADSSLGTWWCGPWCLFLVMICVCVCVHVEIREQF